MEKLREVVTGLERVIVAFSGGADSSFLASVATCSLGAEKVLSVTAVSPSLAPSELADCEALAAEWDLRWKAVETTEMEDPTYRSNGLDRCYSCKTHLMEALSPLAVAEKARVVLGVNVDDLGDHRPGQSAAEERGAEFPLVTAGFTKSEVREASRWLGLRTWDKPAAACLSSRIPYGTPVELGNLRSIAEAEAGLRALGFRQIRVRHYGDLARVELETSDLSSAVDRRDDVVEVVRRAGYRYVTLDLEGFRSGNLNEMSGSQRRSSRP